MADRTVGQDDHNRHRAVNIGLIVTFSPVFGFCLPYKMLKEPETSKGILRKATTIIEIMTKNLYLVFNNALW